MRGFLIAVLAGCGAAPPPAPGTAEEPRRPPIRIEWRAEQAPDDEVTVTIVVDGKPIALGNLPAATETEPGTPRTCAIRAAHLLRTELSCGELASFYAAELIGDELVLTRNDPAEATPREVKRVPVFAGGFEVKAYVVPE